jgi:phage tail-like protein
MNPFETPAVGFHFLVSFYLMPQAPTDVSFQSVSGLEAEMEYESVKEGGLNNYSHQLPTKGKYKDLVLKRGLILGSGVRLWIINAFENYQFEPVDLIISLLNEHHIPLQSWFVSGALPKKWTFSDFDAEKSTIVVETLTLRYNYFKFRI